jgi:hypothetical protein
VNSEMLWDAMIERVCSCTWRPRSGELRDALQVGDQARSGVYLEAVDSEGSAMAAETLFMG